MVTMNAGSSTNQKRSIGAAIVALATVAVLSAQTGQPLGGPKFTAQLNNGDPCNGCKLFAYVGGTTTKQDTYTSSTLGTANANPVVLDSAGRWTIFLDGTKVYKFVLAPATDTDPPGSPLWTVDNVTGQFSGVVTVTAANTRGIQVTRSGADAGISLTSSGGSGKTYGIVSNTSGGLQIRDDADGTPRIEISGNNVTITATGTVATTGNQTVSGTLGVTGATTLGAASVGSTLAVTGATTLGAATVGSTLAVTGVSTFSDNIITSQTIPRVTLIETDGAADNKRWAFAAETEALSLQAVNDAASVGGIVWSVERTGTTVDSFRSSAPFAVGASATPIASIITNTASWDIPSKINGAMEAMTMTLTGVQATSPCFVGFNPNTAGTTISGITMSAYYDSANTVRVVALNTSGGTIDPSTGTVRVTCFTY